MSHDYEKQADQQLSDAERQQEQNQLRKAWFYCWWGNVKQEPELVDSIKIGESQE